MIDWDKMVLAPCMAVFGERVQVQYRPATGTAFPVDGVFDRAFTEVVIGDDGSPMNSVRPVLGVRTAQFPAPPKQGDKLHIASVGLTYVVNNFEPDGHGWALLRLNLMKG